jgi:hypothetical protein
MSLDGLMSVASDTHAVSDAPRSVLGYTTLLEQEASAQYAPVFEFGIAVCK